MPGKSIVVVGGGGAGSQVARSLSRSSALSPSSGNTLTLVTARPFWIYLIAACRFTTAHEGDFAERCLIPYDNIFDGGHGTVKFGTVTKVEPGIGGSEGDYKGMSSGEVVLDSGERIKYDILVLAPGCEWDGPLSFPNSKEGVMDHLGVWWKKFKDSKAVVLIGGGAVAIEYAGEIKEFYPETKVTILHRHSMLLKDSFPAKFRSRVEQDLREVDIDVVFDDSLDDDAVPVEGKIVTRKGRVVDCDLLLPTYGSRPATKFLASLEPPILDASGLIRVNSKLQVDEPSFSNVFAVGDAVNWDELKQVGRYRYHSNVVTANIESILADRDSQKKYRGAINGMAISNGKKKGIFWLSMFWGWPLILGNWAMRLVNGDTMRIEAARRRGFGLRS